MNQETFEQHRPYLFGIAYRMLGSSADAEDVLQDAFLRTREREDNDIDTPKSYLASVVTRLCIDHLRALKRRREEYPGPWLPEPISKFSFSIPGSDQTLSIAFLAMLERLSPLERAVFLLRQAFDYEYEDIAPIVKKTPGNCRQLFARARRKVGAEVTHSRLTRQERIQLYERFLHACSTAEIEPLVSLLSEHITLYSDGGGKVTAALNPIRGAQNVARFLVGILRKAPKGMSHIFADVNGDPAIVSYLDGSVRSVLALHYDANRIAAVYIIANPEKLRGVPGSL